MQNSNLEVSAADQLGSRPRAEASFPRIDFRRQLGRALRVGGIDYLNSRPLIETFDEVAGDQVELTNHPPSRLAHLLREGRLDVALVPVVEYLDSPRAGRYWIAPGIGISSYGSVESIRLYHRAPLDRIGSVWLDGSSMTSVLLTRLLFAARPDARWRGRDGTNREPTYESIEPHRGLEFLAAPAADGAPDAVLLIGDAALEMRPSAGWSVVDLGLEWTRWTGLPFVYAFWVYHGEAIDGLAECLERVALTGYASVDRIVARGPLPAGLSAAAARRYLSHVIRYRLGEAEIGGLEVFAERLRAHGLLSAPPGRLRFLERSGTSGQLSGEGR